MAPVTLESEYLKHELEQMTRIAQAIGPTLGVLHAEWQVSQRAYDVMRQQAHEIPWMTYNPREPRLMFASKPVVTDAWGTTWEFKLVVKGATP